jgi:hypothetical protein
MDTDRARGVATGDDPSDHYCRERRLGWSESLSFSRIYVHLRSSAVFLLHGHS